MNAFGDGLNLTVEVATEVNCGFCHESLHFLPVNVAICSLQKW